MDSDSVELMEELDLKELNVWGANQEYLENQALNELVILSANQNERKLEEGEISEDAPSCSSSSSSSAISQILDINSYISKQNELKKRQVIKKHLEVSSKSVLVANSIANKVCKDNGKRKSQTCEDKNIKAKKRKKEHKKSLTKDSDSDYVPSEEDLSECEPEINDTELRLPKVKRQSEVEKVKDDGLEDNYNTRLEQYYKRLEEEKKIMQTDETALDDVILKGGLHIPEKIWSNLYSYQQKGIEWLWEVNQKSTGGLLGDEMGLGKTVQIVVFLFALNYSKIQSTHRRIVGLGPSIIVCPATVIYQWVKHFHDWAPEFRVAVLHQSGSFQGQQSKLIKHIQEHSGILITTYAGILKFKGILQENHWHYIVLDEGHKIRNPTAKVTVAVKQLRTPHRIMLTGSPMQNNLQELWSLFDFTNPGMLGNMQTFMEHFNNPIVQGGFANASSMQEATALSVATTLKNIISPYLLRRTKQQVQNEIELPSKSEQVLFCSMTPEQRDLYKGYLMTDHVNSILGRGVKIQSDNFVRANMLRAITTLRKICNHPDLYLGEAEEEETSVDSFGFYKRSGKMIVVSALLKIWKKQKHKVLLFTQSRGMITIFQHFLEQNEYKYLKMDGSTTITSRQGLINKFNQDPSYDVFLLTTKVGGLGVNLTGANRVIIYDPDWNPATDTQARERAWRIGQDKDVTIYRLLSAGTIEEKMYQRQVWKQLLSNKILLDPKTHRIFKQSDLYDLFSFVEPSAESQPETTNIFHDSRVKIQEKLLEKKQKRKSKVVQAEPIQFSEDKIQAMKNLAQQLAKSISKPKEEKIKTPYQIELEEEREQKLQEKEPLKKLTAPEILAINREKANKKVDENVNRLDDSDTPCSFSKALEYSENTSKLYNDIKCKNIDVKKIVERHKSKKKSVDKVIVDKSGKLDGEKVENLLKTEVRKKSKRDRYTESNNEGDDYVLAKLFSKKGVSGALQHDSIVQGSVKKGNLRMQTEAEEKADAALNALRKSRVDNWKW